ncbi:MAG: hypothetical protein WCF79_14140 [Rhodomicrobium sp.]
MKRKGRQRPNVAVTLPGSIFQTLRSIGIKDLALARKLGVSRSTINRASAGHSWDVSLSREELARLRAFAEVRLAAAEAAVAALGLCAPKQLCLFD